MRIIRIYQAQELKIGHTILLDAFATNHVLKVLRMRLDASLIIFNGKGGEYLAKIALIEQRKVFVVIEKFLPGIQESNLKIHLGQCVSRGEHMDFSLQKAVELGVTTITPIIAAHCEVRLPQSRWHKLYARWEKIIISAGEQCGRSKLPELHQTIDFSSWVTTSHLGVKLIFHPQGKRSLQDINNQPTNVNIIIGPEGGFSAAEIEVAKINGFYVMNLGPRILRTETASIVAITSVQTRWGDLG